MAKRITKTLDITTAIKHRDLFHSLPAFESLDSWSAWLPWLKRYVCAIAGRYDAVLIGRRECTDSNKTGSVITARGPIRATPGDED